MEKVCICFLHKLQDNDDTIHLRNTTTYSSLCNKPWSCVQCQKLIRISRITLICINYSEHWCLSDIKVTPNDYMYSKYTYFLLSNFMLCVWYGGREVQTKITTCETFTSPETNLHFRKQINKTQNTFTNGKTNVQAAKHFYKSQNKCTNINHQPERECTNSGVEPEVITGSSQYELLLS